MTRNRSQPQRIENNGVAMDALGDVGLIAPRKLALICSQKCPGDVILKTYDFARLVRGSGLAIVSGFHSPIEKDCLPILLRGPDPIIIVQAHRLSTSRLPIAWQRAIDAKRLLLLSPFIASNRGAVDQRSTLQSAVAAVSDRRRRSEIDATGRRSETAATVPNTAKRVTAELAAERNRFVAAISDELLIPFAAPGSKTEALALDLLASAKPVYTFSDRPGPLLNAGAHLIPANFFSPSPATPK